MGSIFQSNGMSGTDSKFGQLTKNPVSRASRAVGGKDGLALMEVMIATFLVLIVFAGGFGALAQGSRLIEISRDETRASQFLQSEVEDIRTYNWDSLITLPIEAKYFPESSFTDAYATRYTVKRLIDTRSSTQKLVTVQVAWMDNSGTGHLREYKTVVSKDGLYDFYYRSF